MDWNTVGNITRTIELYQHLQSKKWLQGYTIKINPHWINNYLDKKNHNLLHFICSLQLSPVLNIKSYQEGQSLILQELCYKVNVNAKNNDGWTPLHVAAVMNNYSATTILCAHQANVNAKDNEGSTPLHHACHKNYGATIAILCAYQANVNVKNNDGWTPLHIAAYYNNTTPITILCAYQANVNAKANDGWTPLHHAVNRNAYAATTILLNNNADITIMNVYGRNAEQMANELANHEIQLLFTKTKVDRENIQRARKNIIQELNSKFNNNRTSHDQTHRNCCTIS